MESNCTNVACTIGLAGSKLGAVLKEANSKIATTKCTANALSNGDE